MSEIDLLLVYARKLNQLQLPYMVTGSIAGVLYGEPRVTHDVDIVLALRPRADIANFARAFPIEEFYCPPEEILLQEALRGQRGHFNLIHHTTGFRADIYLVNRDPLHLWAMQERRKVEIENDEIWLAPPEYVVIRKLEFFREGGSEKHLRDIDAILRVSSATIRVPIIQQWVERLGVAEEWKRALKENE